MFLFLAVITAANTHGQKTDPYFVVHYDTSSTAQFPYLFTDEKGDTIARLDSSRYDYVYTTDTIRTFAIAQVKNIRGWSAIDRNEKIHFQVYNIYIGEPEPDSFHEGLIRVVDNTGRIGFGNTSGEVVIPYQFEFVTEFHKGLAIIASGCKLYSDSPDGEHQMRKCTQYGYINKQGQIIELKAQTFDDVAKKINWQPEE
jgi:hypothetical protein